MLDNKFETTRDPLEDLPDGFFELQIERDEDKSLSEQCVNNIIRKIMAVSNLIHIVSRRGGPDHIIFNGRLGKFIHDNILDEIPHLRKIDLIVREASSDGYDNIEFVRKGDFFKMEYDKKSKDITGMGTVILIKTKHKQPDIVYKIKIKD